MNATFLLVLMLGISYEQSVELEFGFGLLPGNQRFASVFRDCCFEIAEVFEIFDTLLKSSHGLIECLDLFENGGVTHKLPFDLYYSINLNHVSRQNEQNAKRADTKPIAIAFVSEF